MKAGAKPVLQIVDEVSLIDWPSLEVAYIEFFRGEGCPLVNGTLGGEGMNGRPVSSETRAKIRDKLKGRKLSAGHLKKIRETQSGVNHPRFGKKASPEALQRLRDSHLGQTLSREAREKISCAISGMRRSPETIEKMRAGAVARWVKRKEKCGDAAHR